MKSKHIDGISAVRVGIIDRIERSRGIQVDVNVDQREGSVDRSPSDF